ncbi:MAG TPA: histone deacetylase [Myxococcota bacterium]|nr:histone deacetylase [Myxococcota bacterium]
MSESPRPLLVRDARFQEHRPPRAHPERPERLAAIDGALGALAERVQVVAPREATADELLRVHHRQYLHALEEVEGRSAQLDADTYASPRSLEIARLAAGGLVDVALRVARGESKRAFAALRPPGHHAEQGAPMGFCLFNNVAVAVEALRSEAGVERVAIVDWDVHHGNGTQHLFESERDVLFASLHQFPFYPGTGALDEQGGGPGAGATVNLPLPAGCGDAEYGQLFDELLVPMLRAWRPQMILVSAGFDAHARDPLGGMNVSSAGFGAFTERLCAVADEVAGGRIVLALEGGYDLEALAESVSETVRVLAEETPGPRAFPRASASGMRMAEKFRSAYEHYWPVLQRHTRA